MPSGVAGALAARRQTETADASSAADVRRRRPRGTTVRAVVPWADGPGTAGPSEAAQPEAGRSEAGWSEAGPGAAGPWGVRSMAHGYQRARAPRRRRAPGPPDR